MSFIKKLLGREEKVLSIEEALRKFEKETNEEREKRKEEIQELRKKLIQNVEDFKEKINELKKCETEDKLGKTAENVRDDYCRKVNNLLDDFENQLDLNNLMDSFNKLKKSFPKGRSGKYISHFFEEDFAEAKNYLKNSIKIMEELNEKHGLIREYDEISTKKEAIEDNFSEIDELRDQINYITNEVNKVKDEIEKLKNQIPNFDKNDPELKKLKENLEDLKKKEKNLQDEIDSKVSFLPRIFRKYEYETDKEIEKDPIDILMDSQEDFKEIIKDIAKLVEKNELNISKSKSKKINSLKTNFDVLKEKSSKLKTIKEQKNDINDQLDEIKENMREKKKKTEKNLEENKKKLKELKRKKTNKQEKIKSLKQEIKDLKKKLENKISENLSSNIKIKEIIEE